MKVLKYFFPKDQAATAAQEGKSSEFLSTTGSHSSGSGKLSAKAGKRKSKTKKNTAEEKSANVLAVESFLKNWTTFTGPEAVLAHFASEKSPMILEDGMRLSPKQCVGALKMLHASFPDLEFKSASIKDKSSNEVVVDNMYGVGTHTGAPFTCKPGMFPAIPATGKHCRNDDAIWYCKMTDDNKIKSIEVIALGSKTGPAGMYELIGGSLAPNQIPKA